MVAAYRSTHGPSLLAWTEAQQPLGVVLNSSDELLRWLFVITGL